jgi:hypothetical protein
MKKTKKHSNKELAEAHVFPSQLTPAEKEAAESEFSRFRLQKLKNRSDTEEHYSRLMQLKYIMEDYTNSREYKEEYTFSYFLNRYLITLNKRKTQFSKEIDLHTAQLSRLLNDKDGPSQRIFVRLEIHSNNVIPAIDWFRVYEKQVELELLKNKKIRKEEAKHVKVSIAL